MRQALDRGSDALRSGARILPPGTLVFAWVSARAFSPLSPRAHHLAGALAAVIVAHAITPHDYQR